MDKDHGLVPAPFDSAQGAAWGHINSQEDMTHAVPSFSAPLSDREVEGDTNETMAAVDALARTPAVDLAGVNDAHPMFGIASLRVPT